MGDANKNTFKLSLNTEKNCFKCWLCKHNGGSGGVLEFESRLTGKTFQEVREKYFGKDSKKRHYAEYLSPGQLRKIGWDEYKRNSREDFLKRRDDVLRDWNAYRYEEAVKHFALFMVSAHLPDQERLSTLLEYIQSSCEKTGIYLLFSQLATEFAKEDETRSEWAKEGVELARAAWLASLQSGDRDLKNAVKYVLFLCYFRKCKVNSNEIKRAVI